MTALARQVTYLRLIASDQAKTRSGFRALAAATALPLSFGPRRLALHSLDYFLRFNADSAMAGPAYRRALELAAAEPVRDERITLDRSIVLKVPDRAAGERGVLLTSFEPQLAKLAASAQLNALVESYDVAFLPTWQPFYSIPLFQFAARAPGRMLLMPSSSADYDLCRRRHDDLVALPFQASSWVNPRFHTPAAAKDMDILMVANFSTYKRHWHLFRALRDLPRDLRVVLAGVPLEGRTRETLLQEAAIFGTADRFEIVERAPDATVADLMSRARVFLALSAKEGSYISMAEALFSDTPVGVYRNAVIGSKDYINDHTGRLLDDNAPLAPQLMRFLQDSSTFAPRAWAVTNISAEVNSRRLDKMLRARAREQGQPWSRGIAPFYCRHFNFHYEREEDEERFAPAHREFEEQFGIRITRPGRKT